MDVVYLLADDIREYETMNNEPRCIVPGTVNADD
jgi:hypothetical protein